MVRRQRERGELSTVRSQRLYLIPRHLVGGGGLQILQYGHTIVINTTSLESSTCTCEVNMP